jgi:tRNA(Ile)-lysidine synthetase-like protein
MRIDIKPGRYIIAVSGGVDSVVLLHALQQAYHANSTVSFIVAHVDHGIRPDSPDDLALVRQLADGYGLTFVSKTLQLGAGVSEDVARKARYAFLERVSAEHDADAIITAHHQDDVIETAVLNMLRGTHRKGLTSLASTSKRIRPLLHTPKKQIISYARANGLVWHEDSTNTDTAYARNAVRHHIVPKMTPLQRQHMLAHIMYLRGVNTKIDHELANLLHLQSGNDVLDRKQFAQLPFAVAVELLAAWLRKAGICEFDRKGLVRMVISAKTYMPGRRIDVDGQWCIEVNSRSLALVCRNC